MIFGSESEACWRLASREREGKVADGDRRRWFRGSHKAIHSLVLVNSLFYHW